MIRFLSWCISYIDRTAAASIISAPQSVAMSATQPSNVLPVKDDDARSSASEDSDISNEEGWEDVEPDDETQPVVGLFSEKVYPDVHAMLKETKEKYNFDLQKIQKELGV